MQLYIGQATDKVGTSTQDPAWFEEEEMTDHLFLNRQYPELDGNVLSWHGGGKSYAVYRFAERAQPAGVGSRGLAACCTNGP